MVSAHTANTASLTTVCTDRKFNYSPICVPKALEYPPPLLDPDPRDVQILPENPLFLLAVSSSLSTYVSCNVLYVIIFFSFVGFFNYALQHLRFKCALKFLKKLKNAFLSVMALLQNTPAHHSQNDLT